jgi:predicted nucleic acid-binding protein
LLRGKVEAANAITSISKEDRFCSIISYMEMIQGIRNKKELELLNSMINNFNFAILPLSEKIGQLACELMIRYKLSSGLEVQDALIAATVVVFQDILYTGNIKHFKDLEIKIKIFSI